MWLSGWGCAEALTAATTAAMIVMAAQTTFFIRLRPHYTVAQASQYRLRPTYDNGHYPRDLSPRLSCERLRMPAMRMARHTPPAGVRKRPREEIAGGERRACGWRYGDWSAAHAVVDAGR